MFDLGFWELLLIGVVALIVVGPERLPALASFVGQWVGRARRFVNHMRNEIQQELETEHLKSLVEEQNRELQSLKREVADVRDDADTVTRETREEVGAIEKEAAAEPAAPSGQAGTGRASQQAEAGGKAAPAAAKKTASKSTKKSAGKKRAQSKKKSAARANADRGAPNAPGEGGGTPDEAVGGRGGEGGRR